MASIVSDRPDIAAAFASLTIDIPADATPEIFLGLARELMNRYGGADPASIMQDVTVVPVNADGVEAEYQVPAELRTDRRIVYLHGGAWIAGGLSVYRLLGAVLAKLSNCAVLVVDYRLAPEHPFPAALDDAATAFDWARQNGPHGSGAATVCVAGDSAGANLAAALCIKRISDGSSIPARLALLCGVLDLNTDDDVARCDPLSDASALAGSVALYTQSKVTLDDPLISPIQATDDVIEQFPPTMVQASGAEFLLGGSRRFAARLANADTRSVLSIWPDMPHSWHCFLDTLPESREALAEVSAFLRA